MSGSKFLVRTGRSIQVILIASLFWPKNTQDQLKWIFLHCKTMKTEKLKIRIVAEKIADAIFDPIKWAANVRTGRLGLFRK